MYRELRCSRPKDSFIKRAPCVSNDWFFARNSRCLWEDPCFLKKMLVSMRVVVFAQLSQGLCFGI